MTTKRITIFLYLLALAATLSACITTQRDVSVFSGLVLQFDADCSRAQVGTPVRMRFKVENTREYTIVLESQNTPVMDIIISSYGSGKVFLTWSAQNPDKVAHRLEWKPGESKTIEMVWTPRQEDIAIGVFHNVHLAGILNRDSRLVQSASVDVCASEPCWQCKGLFCLP